MSVATGKHHLGQFTDLKPALSQCHQEVIVILAVAIGPVFGVAQLGRTFKPDLKKALGQVVGFGHGE